MKMETLIPRIFPIKSKKKRGLSCWISLSKRRRKLLCRSKSMSRLICPIAYKNLEKIISLSLWLCSVLFIWWMLRCQIHFSRDQPRVKSSVLTLLWAGMAKMAEFSRSIKISSRARIWKLKLRILSWKYWQETMKILMMTSWRGTSIWLPILQQKLFGRTKIVNLKTKFRKWKNNLKIIHTVLWAKWI